MSLLSIAAAALALSSAPAEPGPCRGPAVQPGAEITGVVLHVFDGSRLCLADGPTPDRWTEISLGSGDLKPTVDQDPTWAKAALMSAAFGKKLTCRVQSAESGLAVATCGLQGAALTDLLSAPDREAAAAEWRRRPVQATLVANR